MEPVEPYIVKYIQDYAKQNGNFPPNATSQIDTITPLSVIAGGFYTDWHVVTHVVVQIVYQDSSRLDLNFETMEKTSRTLVGIETTTFFAGFRPLEECELENTTWHCR